MLRPDQGFLAVEVKTLQNYDFLERRIAPTQIARLRRTWKYLLENAPGTLFQVAFIAENKEPLILSLSDF